MCFSATASFVTAGILTSIGITALLVSKSKYYFMIACIPLLFAIQQTSEGIVWLTHTYPNHLFLHNLSTLIFLIFAFLVWPIWIPCAFFISEQIKIRRNTLGLLIVLGILLFILNIYLFSLHNYGMTLVSKHVEYLVGYPQVLPMHTYLFIYAVITVLPFFITSLKYCRLAGLLFFASLIVTDIYLFGSFISVWCFFAAVLSCFFVFIVRQQ